jgi:hypothetical protein
LLFTLFLLYVKKFATGIIGKIIKKIKENFFINEICIEKNKKNFLNKKKIGGKKIFIKNFFFLFNKIKLKEKNLFLK